MLQKQRTTLKTALQWLALSHVITLFKKNWSIANLQYFRCRAKWYICIIFVRFFFSLIGYYKILSIVPCAIFSITLPPWIFVSATQLKDCTSWPQLFFYLCFILEDGSYPPHSFATIFLGEQWNYCHSGQFSHYDRTSFSRGVSELATFAFVSPGQPGISSAGAVCDK